MPATRFGTVAIVGLAVVLLMVCCGLLTLAGWTRGALDTLGGLLPLPLAAVGLPALWPAGGAAGSGGRLADDPDLLRSVLVKRALGPVPVAGLDLEAGSHEQMLALAVPEEGEL